MRGRPFLVFVLLLCASCGKPSKEGAPGKQRPGLEGVVRFEGVEVPRNLVEPYVPFVLSLRPSLAPDSARRFILLRFALPMAWALKEEPKGFENSRVQARQWLEEIRRGKTTLLDLVKKQLRKYGEDPSQARPLTTPWTGLPLPLAKAAFSAKKGQVEGPILIPQGWCLFKVEKIAPGLTRDQDLLTLLEVVAPPDGKAFWEKLREFQRRLAGSRGEIEVLDPSFEEVVPFIKKKRRPPARRKEGGDAKKEHR